jgi:hypothetical protein
MTGDGRVTLNEAYQFAFNETLAQTTSTEGGAQHPSYDIKMSGSGDVVMTDLRETSSTLVLGEGQYGRFYVLDSDRQLVAELHKALGRRVELGVEPGTYDVFVEQDATRRTASVTLADGERRELTAAELHATKLLPSRRRGPEDRADLLDGRLRAQIGVHRLERWRTAGRPLLGPPLEQARARLRVLVRNGQFVASGTDILLGARYYPSLGGPFRPYGGLLLGRAEVVDGLGTPPGFTQRGQFAAADTGRRGRLLRPPPRARSGTRTCLAGGGRRNFETFVGVGFLFGGRSRSSDRSGRLRRMTSGRLIAALAATVPCSPAGRTPLRR